MCAEPTEKQTDPWIWRFLVDKNQQGTKIGTFGVQKAIDCYQEMGCKRVLVSWQPKEINPLGFHFPVCFKEPCETIDDEIAAELLL